MKKEWTRGNATRKYLSGDEFKEWRLSRGLILKDLADWLGVSIGAIHLYEKNGCTKAVALALAAIDRGIPPASADERHSSDAETEAGDSADETSEKDKEA
jgi:predicted transcriptional regulator